MSEKLTVRVGTRVPEDLAGAFAARAAAEERSVSALLRLLMRRHVDESSRRDSAPPDGISVGQLAALHAKANELDRLRGQPRGAAKGEALEVAGQLLGRPITSSKDMLFAEASRILDWLTDRIDEAREALE